jgi:phage shock protein PspC (stress-responsive transcriptional regulator)
VTIEVMIDPDRHARDAAVKPAAAATPMPPGYIAAPTAAPGRPSARATGEERTVTATAATRRATRRVDGRLIGGVAGGLADHLGFSALHVRIIFALLAWFGGFGVLLYGVLWFVMPQANQAEVPVGIAAATRSGRRTPARRRAEDIGQIVA